MRTELEVKDLRDDAIVAANQPSKFSGMTYEQGVEAALEWVLGATNTSPLDDEF